MERPLETDLLLHPSEIASPQLNNRLTRMKRILVLEDDRRVAAALNARLRYAGYDVLVAPDAAFATVLAATYPPDLIISDIWMPAMQGMTFIRCLKSLGLTEAPFIFITASHKEGQWESAMELGAAGYFEKPYDPVRLLAAVSDALQPRDAP